MCARLYMNTVVSQALSHQLPLELISFPWLTMSLKVWTAFCSSGNQFTVQCGCSALQDFCLQRDYSEPHILNTTAKIHADWNKWMPVKDECSYTKQKCYIRVYALYLLPFLSWTKIKLGLRTFEKFVSVIKTLPCHLVTKDVLQFVSPIFECVVHSCKHKKQNSEEIFPYFLNTVCL